MSEFRAVDKQHAGMQGYVPVDRTCDQCGLVIEGPGLFRAGREKGVWLCRACAG